MGNPLYGTKVVTYSDGKKYTVNSDNTRYNQRGDIVSITDALGHVEHNAYDLNGRLQTHTRFDGAVFTYEYDDNDNVTIVSWVENGIPYLIRHTYYNDNSLQSISNENATTNYEYYLDGSNKSIQYPNGSQQYTRDQYSRLIAQQDPSGAITSYTRNNLGQVTTVQQGNEALAYIYGTVNHQNGAVTGMQLSGEKHWTYQYHLNGWGKLLSAQVQERDPATQVLAITRSYDERGRAITSTKSSATPDKNMNLTKAHTYDGFGQLLSSTTTYTDGSPSIKEEYTYDGNNNVLTRNATGSPEQSFTYNVLDQLTTSGITYDQNGRIRKDDQGNSYTYNQQDELIKVISPTGEDLVSYTYYPDGLLQSRTENKTNHQNFFYDGGTVNAVSTDTPGKSNQIWTSFLFNGQERIGAYEQTQQPLYYVAANGSAGATVTGDTTTGLDYKPYGAPQPTANQSTPSLPANKNFTWNQEYVDPATNLVYLRTRFYNPRLMRFMSRDTTPLYNRYAFGNGDPINMIDPTGMMPQWASDLLGGLSIAFSGLEIAMGAALVSTGVGAGLGALLITSGVLGIASGSTSIAADHTSGKISQDLRYASLGIGIGGAIAGIGVGAGGLAGVGAGINVATKIGSGAMIGSGVLGIGSNATGIAAQATGDETLGKVSMGLGYASVGVGILGAGAGIYGARGLNRTNAAFGAEDFIGPREGKTILRLDKGTGKIRGVFFW